MIVKLFESQKGICKTETCHNVKFVISPTVVFFCMHNHLGLWWKSGDSPVRHYSLINILYWFYPVVHWATSSGLLYICMAREVFSERFLDQSHTQTHIHTHYWTCVHEQYIIHLLATYYFLHNRTQMTVISCCSNLQWKHACWLIISPLIGFAVKHCVE